MKIVLVHRNFPGQFRYLAPALIKRGDEVRALTWSQNQNQRQVPTIEYEVEPPPGNNPVQHYAANLMNAQAAANAAAAYSQAEGFVPDLVIGSINWGETLFLRDVWPEARHIGYAEFFYDPKGRDTDFDPEFSRPDLARDMRVVARTPHLLMGATRSDHLISPTKWQASTFPSEFRSKISVVHDGVDTTMLQPDPGARFKLPNGQELKAGDEVLTFVNRNLEPYRGFHILMRALPTILKARPNLQVVMVGGEERGYGPVPAPDVTWKQVMMREVGDKLDTRRLHFTGRIPYADLVSLLQVSRAHVYLSYPFVLSWSMMESMALGCLVIGSDTPPVAEVIEHQKNGLLVDFFDVPGWEGAIIDALENPKKYQPLRDAARAHIVETYDLKTRCLPRLLDVVDGNL
ncbi:MAG: glycosyltransferase [Rhodobacteraceae bacterium]|nr:glycosyltransferase [Paracoccaceae bacterium]